MAAHSSIIAWSIPWMEEPGGLQSTESQRVGQDWANLLSLSDNCFEYLHVGFPKIISKKNKELQCILLFLKKQNNFYKFYWSIVDL